MRFQANIVNIIPYNLRKAANVAQQPASVVVVVGAVNSPPASLNAVVGATLQQQEKLVAAAVDKQVPASLKQRVNSIVMKTLADNTGKDQMPSIINQSNVEPYKIGNFQNCKIVIFQIV